MTAAKSAPKSAAKKRGLGRGLEALLGPKAADVQPLQATPAYVRWVEGEVTNGRA